MVISRTVTKKVLESIIHETFSIFGVYSSSSLLDSLKLLGFYYATNAGISINIEDLKTPDAKEKFIEKANQEIDFVSSQWKNGYVSDVERFQSIIDSWNVATEGLKTRIIDYYQYFDPANNLYIMAFSGARGNMSQVRQLVGMRGLMSDQNGKIIDLPIQRNFREGLSSIDYIVSSYGARKGIVDTALKTADSGYLTRRLIYLAQDLVIREMNCGSTTGILFFLKRKNNTKNLIGRYLIWGKKQSFPYSELREKNIFLTSPQLDEFQKSAPLVLNVRSPLTCKSSSSLCQFCYGSDLAQNKLISLGEAVGIIAAQSIGEPGTQLTMRTFHTGGIFTGETVKQILAPFSGKVFFPSSFRAVSYRTNHGIFVFKIQQETKLKIVDWKGKEEEISLNIGSFLYLKESCFLQKGALIAEYSNQSFLLGKRRMKPIYSSLSGQVKFENTMIAEINPKTWSNIGDGVLWVCSGKIFPIPFQSKIKFQKTLNPKSPFAQLKIVTLLSGFVQFSSDSLQIFQPSHSFLSSENKKSDFLDIYSLLKSFPNCSVEWIPFVQNYQFVDSYTVLGMISIFPTVEGLIYSIQKNEPKDSKQRETFEKLTTFFVVSDADVWKIHADQLNTFSFQKNFIRPKSALNSVLNFSRSGYFLKQDGFEMIFQQAEATFLKAGTLLKYSAGDFIYQKGLLAKLVNYDQQTEDIVQGLPKVEELIEARKLKQSCFLAKAPGIVIHPSFAEKIEKDASPEEHFYQIDSKGIIQCKVPLDKSQKDICYHDYESVAKRPVKRLVLSYSSFPENFVLFLDRAFQPRVIPPFVQPRFQRNIRIKLNKFGEVARNKKGKIKTREITFLLLKHFLMPLENIALNLLSDSVPDESELFSLEFEYEQPPEREQEEDPEIEEQLRLSEDRPFILALKKFKEMEQFSKIFRLKGSKSASLLEDFVEPRPENNQLYQVQKDVISPWTKIAFPKSVEYPEWMLAYGDSKQNRILKISEDGEPTDPPKFVFLESLQPFQIYRMPASTEVIVNFGEFVDVGQPLTDGIIDIHQLLQILFEHHRRMDGTIQGTTRSVQKFQLILVNSIQAIYQSQGVSIASKHIELIVRQMTSKVLIRSGGNTPFLPGELISFSLVSQVCLALQDAASASPENSFLYQFPSFEPKVLSATTSSLTKESFLSAAGFQETKRVLSKAALEGSSDWLRGLKECIMIGRLIPAGSTFLNYKNYLDKVYSFLK